MGYKISLEDMNKAFKALSKDYMIYAPKLFEVKEENIWISQERKMCCGIGKCGHCKIDDVYICLEGPVFNYTKGKHLRD